MSLFSLCRACELDSFMFMLHMNCNFITNPYLCLTLSTFELSQYWGYRAENFYFPLYRASLYEVNIKCTNCGVKTYIGGALR